MTASPPPRCLTAVCRLCCCVCVYMRAFVVLCCVISLCSLCVCVCVWRCESEGCILLVFQSTWSTTLGKCVSGCWQRSPLSSRREAVSTWLAFKLKNYFAEETSMKGRLSLLAPRRKPFEFPSCAKLVRDQSHPEPLRTTWTASSATMRGAQATLAWRPA